MQLQTEQQGNQSKVPTPEILQDPRICANPYLFVMWAYRWGEGLLANEEGPDEWQKEALIEIGEQFARGGGIRKSIKSGHEVGKTALAAWIIHWFISTKPFPQIVATANTKTQLETKLWRELAKWHNLSRHRYMFRWTATKFYHYLAPDTWFAAAIPWSKEKSEAFQGTHEKYTLIVYDEASTIDDVIWESTDGSISARGLWLVTGNPTRNTGRFKECWGRFRHRWSGSTIDSRRSKHADQERIEGWIEDYGEDSDFVRIRVKGEFPRASTAQFISSEVVEAARGRGIPIDSFKYAPIVFGVDLARFGDDQSVICVRQGLHIHEFRKYREKDEMQMVGYIVEAMKHYSPQVVFIESGMGAGVIDRLRQLGFRNIIEVIHKNYGPSDNQTYFNVRTHLWGNMRDWLKMGALPNDQELLDDLIGPEYGFDMHNRFQLEKKEDMKTRGLASPDAADSLAFTFFMSVPTNEERAMMQEHMAEEQYLALDPEAGI